MTVIWILGLALFMGGVMFGITSYGHDNRVIAAWISFVGAAIVLYIIITSILYESRIAVQCAEQDGVFLEEVCIDESVLIELENEDGT